MSKLHIGFTLNVFTDEVLKGGEPVKNEAEIIRSLAIEFGWKETPPDPHAPQWNQFVITQETDPAAIQAIRAQAALTQQTVIVASHCQPGELDYFKAKNAEFAAAYEMACEIAKVPAFIFEDTFAQALLGELKNKRLQFQPPAAHKEFSEIFDSNFAIA